MDEYISDKIMPWIGMYITAASMACVVAMAADAFIAIRTKKFWFPCKYFSLNATSLTLLAIATKILVDLNTNVDDDELNAFARLNCAAFLPSAVNNFLPSMGSMTNTAILANSIALALLVITIVVNLWIRSIMINYYFDPHLWIHTAWMLLALAAVVSSAIALPSIKRRLESKYQDMYQIALTEEENLQGRDVPQIGLMVEKLKKHMVMSETSNPQFVMARSVIVSTTSSAIYLLSVILFIAFSSDLLIIFTHSADYATGAYGVSTICITVVQFIGIAIAFIVSEARWFLSISFKFPITTIVAKQVFTIERVWIEDLLYWRDSFTISQSQLGYFNKCLHNAKWLALTFCIGLQYFFVFISKLALFISTLLATTVFQFIICVNKLWVNSSTGESTSDNKLVNLSRYVLLLEGEGKLPKWILKNICQHADSLIQQGRKQQPKHLIHLLTKFKNFNGVKEFDNGEVQSLLSQEPPNSWSLPLVTLTSIMIAFPNIPDHKAMELVKGVGEGLSLVKNIEEDLDGNGRILNARRAADVTWVGVAVYRKWQGIDLKRKSDECRNSKQALEELSLNAESIILKFKKEHKDLSLGSPLNWPEKVISACSMYRITQTILLSCPVEEVQSDEELFDQWCVVIADILAACLTNLQSLILRMCHHNAIEKRLESIDNAFLVLGRTEQILEKLHTQGRPFPERDYANSIDEWRDISV